jgi:hypothetical protein
MIRRQNWQISIERLGNGAIVILLPAAGSHFAIVLITGQVLPIALAETIVRQWIDGTCGDFPPRTVISNRTNPNDTEVGTDTVRRSAFR